MKGKTISILGAGWLGLPLGQTLAADGWHVRGSTTTLEKLRDIEAVGVEPYLICLEPEPQEDARDFFDAEVMFLNVPPGLRHGGSGAYYLRQMEAVSTQAAASGVNWVIFASSTSVYPDTPGAMTEADAQPTSEAGKVLLDVEERLRLNPAFDVTILRFGGLYGQDRHPINSLQGRSDLAGGEAPVNLIHLDDAIGVVLAVLEKEARNVTLNVVSDEHPSRRVLYPALARKIGLPPPTYRAGDGKLVRNEALKRTLSYEFRHPDPATWPEAT